MRNELKRHGAFSWFELMTDKVNAAKDFYAKIFGWEFEKMPMDGGDYFMIKVGGEQVGGIMKKPESAAGAPCHWATYIAVDDIDAVVARTAAAGGKIIVPPQDIPNVGRFAVVQDPQGASISAITYVE